MTNITFKNGLPVVLQPSAGSEYVLVASSVACCPDSCPDFCWDCLSDCAYVHAVTAPSELAVSARSAKCGLVNNDFDNTGTGFLYEDVFPEGTVFGRPGDSFQPHLSFAEVGSPLCFLGACGFGPGANVTHLGSGWISLDEEGCSSLDYRVLLHAEVLYYTSCIVGQRPSPFRVTVFVFVSAYVYQAALGQYSGASGGCSGFWTWRANGRFQVPSTCGSFPDRQCNPPLSNQDYRVIDTPFEFTATGTETTLGPYDETVGPTTSGSSASVIAIATTVGEAMRDALSATFEIDARETCDLLQVCCCGTNGGVSEISEEDVCDGTTSPVLETPLNLEDVTVVVDWDGLSVTLDYPYFSGSPEEFDLDFLCDDLQMTRRGFTANLTASSAGGCLYFTGNVNLNIVNDETAVGATAATVNLTFGLFVGECKLFCELPIGDWSQDACAVPAYNDFVTMQMIIAP